MKLKKIVCCLVCAALLNSAYLSFALTEQQDQTQKTGQNLNTEDNNKQEQEIFVGQIIGKTLNTDIAAYINHYPIESHNVDNYICVPADELSNYGFDVEWNGVQRTLNITRTDKNTIIGSSKNIFRSTLAVGSENLDIYHTDIRTFINGKQVTSYNVGGKTLIYFDDLAVFGTEVWVPEVRAIKLWVAGLPVTSFKYIPYENMYKTYGQSGAPDFEDVTGAKLETYSYADGVANYKYPYDQSDIDKYIEELKYLNYEVTEKEVGTAIHYNIVKEKTSFIVTADSGKQLLWVVCMDKGQSEPENYPGTGLLTYTCITGYPVKYTVYFSGAPSVNGYSADGEGFTYEYNSKEFERYLYHLGKNGYVVKTSGFNPEFKETIYSISNEQELYQIIVQPEKKLMCVRTVLAKAENK